VAQDEDLKILVAGAVDRAFDIADQTLAAQRQLALTLTGVATHQVATAVETIETTGIETTHRIKGELQRGRERVAQPQAGTGDAPKSQPPSRTASRTDAPMRSAASRSSASGPRIWRSKAAQR
jgi:hypothetical protein